MVVAWLNSLVLVAGCAAAFGGAFLHAAYAQQGKPVKIEFLLAQTEFERVLLPFKRNLAEVQRIAVTITDALDDALTDDLVLDNAA